MRLSFVDLRIASLLFAADVLSLASLDRELQRALERFVAECEAVWMTVSTSVLKALLLRWELINCSNHIGSGMKKLCFACIYL